MLGLLSTQIDYVRAYNGLSDFDGGPREPQPMSLRRRCTGTREPQPTRLVLVHGRDPLTRQFAEEIIASQQTEIASMQARLRSLANGPGKDGREFPALSGTRGAGQPRRYSGQ